MVARHKVEELHARTVQSPNTPDRAGLKLRKPKTKAAGLPAVTSSAIHGMTKMGVRKTIKTLTMVNQQDGFDCPGCAWHRP